MVRRIIEEDTTTAPNTTYVDSDGSWIGRTIVALVVIALLVIGAVWLFNNVGDTDGGGGGDRPVIENNENNDTDVNVPAPDTNQDPNPVSS